MSQNVGSCVSFLLYIPHLSVLLLVRRFLIHLVVGFSTSCNRKDQFHQQSKAKHVIGTAAHALDTMSYGSHSLISSFLSLWTSCQPGSFPFTSALTLVNHHPQIKRERSLQTPLCCRSAATVSAAVLNRRVQRWDRVALLMPLL